MHLHRIQYKTSIYHLIQMRKLYIEFAIILMESLLLLFSSSLFYNSNCLGSFYCLCHQNKPPKLTNNGILCFTAIRSIGRLCNCKQTTIILCSAFNSLLLLLQRLFAIIKIAIIRYAQNTCLNVWNGTSLTISSRKHHYKHF